MTFNRELAAMVLVDAAYKGDKAAAELYGLTDRTLRNYRKRLLADTELSALFQHKRALVEKDWAADAPMAIKAGVAFLLRAAQEATVTPEMVHAVAGSMKLLADMVLTKQVLDARLAAAHRPENGVHREVAAPAGQPSLN